MAERKLKSRRRRRRRANKGRLIRVSTAVYETLDRKRRNGFNLHALKSWDCYLRCMLGLPDRAGVPQPLVEGVLEATTGMFILRVGETSWQELEDTARKIGEQISVRKQVRPAAPVRMREIR